MRQGYYDGGHQLVPLTNVPLRNSIYTISELSVWQRTVFIPYVYIYASDGLVSENGLVASITNIEMIIIGF